MDDRLVASALEAIARMDLAEADGRAAVSALLRQIEDQAPGSIEAMAARLQLRRLGWNQSPVH